MNPNIDNARQEGAPAPLPGWHASQGVPPPQPTQPIGQPDGGQTTYVPPELRPSNTGADGPYAPPYSGGLGEPTRQWGAPPPPYSTPSPRQAMAGRHRGRSIVWPLMLIAFGLVFLLNSLNLLDWRVWGQLWRLWPLALVAIGFDLLIGRRNPALSLLVVVGVFVLGAAFVYATGGLQTAGPVSSYTLNVPSTGAKSADVQIDFGVGDLKIDGLAGDSSQLATGSLDYFQNQSPPVPNVTNGETVSLHLKQGNTNGTNFWHFGGPNNDLSWNIRLSQQIPMTLKVQTGAGDSTIDMSQLKVSSFSLQQGVGSTQVTFSEKAGATNAVIKGGIGDLNIAIPQSVQARITTHSGIGDVSVPNGYVKNGDTYTSAGYDEASNKLDLDVNVGIGSVDISSK